tara:strand:+ start:1614 stop:1838 length:225 start_codon:yes stop_codon:yes gene_type:complete
MESRRRSVAKAFSWRITATVTTTIISYFITGNVSMAVKIGGFEFVAKMLLYYIHERGWANLKFGVDKDPGDFQI